MLLAVLVGVASGLVGMGCLCGLDKLGKYKVRAPNPPIGLSPNRLLEDYR
jgi:hypothetical protein